MDREIVVVKRNANKIINKVVKHQNRILNNKLR